MWAAMVVGAPTGAGAPVGELALALTGRAVPDASDLAEALDGGIPNTIAISAPVIRNRRNAAIA